MGRVLVVDTNSLPEIIMEEDRLKKLIDKCDTVYIPDCVWNEVEGRHMPMLRLDLVRNCKKLEELNKFREEKPKCKIPKDLERTLRRRGASDCDIDIVKLALHRKNRGNDVIIVTKNERDFQNVKELRDFLKKNGIEIIYPWDYCELY